MTRGNTPDYFVTNIIISIDKLNIIKKTVFCGKMSEKKEETRRLYFEC
jgi:hypothetical protein